MKMKRKHFKDYDKAKAFAKQYKEKVFHWAEDSPTKYEYKCIVEVSEGYFDEEYAKEFPYCVSYIEM